MTNSTFNKTAIKTGYVLLIIYLVLVALFVLLECIHFSRTFFHIFGLAFQCWIVAALTGGLAAVGINALFNFLNNKLHVIFALILTAIVALPAGIIYPFLICMIGIR
ncbi:hypothetical protein ZL58_14610 [Salmonella enterica subsp. enterica serovar Typhimurium]|nr:hypothetical protein [Salmonella enterica subsp. enterica serovar Typhimurium]